MKISILTLFPNMFTGFLNESIIKRAINSTLVDIEIIDIRDFSELNNKQVDDMPYGGGAGMVLMCEPVVKAIDSVKKDNSKVILLTPAGNPFKQSKALELSKYEHIILICGHYEGIDERILNYIDEEISIGDYVLTGGEIPAMVVADATIRLIEGVITKESYENESFMNNSLDYPVYTRPQEFDGHKVPDVLLSGNHQEIAKWRSEVARKKTEERRPDLLDKEV